MRIIQGFIAAFSIVLLAACTVNPVTGEKEWTPMSAQQEVALGAQKYQPYQQQQGGLYIVDPELNVYVNRVGQKIAAVSDRPNLPYEFVVLNNSVPNAWALPGGKIAINRGLLNLLDDEAQLAAVLSHEIVHAAARHSAQQMAQQTLLSVGMMAAGVAAQKTEYGQWIAAGAGLGANLWQARYGRSQESEADEYGIKYMLAAGYNPQGAVELQEKFVALSSGSNSNFLSTLMASHPSSQARLARNRELTSGLAGGDRNRAGFQRAIAQLEKDKPAYDLHQQAAKAANDGDLKSASALVDKAIAKQPKETLFWVMKGQLLMNDKKISEAKSAFQKAVSANPEYYMGHLGLGMSLLQLKQNAEAESALKTSMGFLQTPTASYYLGELSLAKGDKESAKSYFEFAAQSSGDLGKAAQARLAELNPPPPSAPAAQ